MSLTINDLRRACELDDLSEVKKLKSNGKMQDKQVLVELCRVASSTERLTILGWSLRELEHFQGFKQVLVQVASNAAENGHLAVLKWLLVESRYVVSLNEAAYTGSLLRAAVRRGDLEMLRWMLTESTQQVDVSSENNAALRLALSRSFSDNHPEVVPWLLLESGQLAQILSRKDRNWIYRVPKTLRPRIEQAARLHRFLKRFHLPATAREKYLLSDVCFQAIEAGLSPTLEGLDQLLKVSHASEKRRQL